MARIGYFSLLLFASFFFLAAVPYGARAQAILYVDADAAGANDGSSWADAYTDLQDALAALENMYNETATMR